MHLWFVTFNEIVACAYGGQDVGSFTCTKIYLLRKKKVETSYQCHFWGTRTVLTLARSAKHFLSCKWA